MNSHYRGQKEREREAETEDRKKQRESDGHQVDRFEIQSRNHEILKRLVLMFIKIVFHIIYSFIQLDFSWRTKDFVNSIRCKTI